MFPREKLLKYWSSNLTWTDLVAIILWTWIKWLDVFKLSKKVFELIEEKKDKLRVEDLIKIKWIWEVKALQLISAFELAKRYYLKWDIIVKNIDDVLEQIWEYRNKKQEYFLTLNLDWWNRLLNKNVITIWILNQSIIHPREVFADAIESRANSMILIHNHPSWNPIPSQEDRNVTNTLIEASKILWVNILDHVIITSDSHFSFRENWFL